MTARSSRMLEAFAEYETTRARLTDEQNTVHMLPGTRLMRMQRLAYGWRLWLATRDYIHGSYLEVYDNGQVVRYETRFDEGDETILVRQSNDEIRSKAHGS